MPAFLVAALRGADALHLEVGEDRVHLAAGAADRRRQAPVDRAGGLFDVRERGVHDLVGLRERRLGGGVGGPPIEGRLVAGREFVEADPVLIQHAELGLREDGDLMPGDHEGTRDPVEAVEVSHLGVVGDLRRSADVHRGRQQEVLDQRPEQHGGAQALDTAVENRFRPLSGGIGANPGPHSGRSRAEDAVALGAGLPLEADRLDFPGAGRDPPAAFGFVPDRVLVHGKGEPFELRAGGVHHHEARTPREVQEQPAERLRKRPAGRVAVTGGEQEISGVFRFGKDLRQLRVQVEDRVVQNPAERRQADVFVLRLVTERVRGARAVQQPGVSNLLEVVVVAFDPEDRDRRLAGLRLQFAGGGDRGPSP